MTDALKEKIIEEMRNGFGFVECPVCRQMTMPKGNHYCSVKCYEYENGRFTIGKKKEDEEVKDE